MNIENESAQLFIEIRTAEKELTAKLEDAGSSFAESYRIKYTKEAIDIKESINRKIELLKILKG